MHPSESTKLELRAIIAWVDASVVTGFVDTTPVGPVDSTPVGGVRTVREGAGDLDPTVLKTGDQPDERCEFAEVLVLAENQYDVELIPMGSIERVERQPDVDAFLLAAEKRVSSKARNVDGFVTINQRPAVDYDAATSHHGELVRPEPMPKSVVRRRRDARIELHAIKRPSVPGANGSGQFLHVVVWIRVAEGVTRVMEKVLAVNEGNGAFDGRFCRHGRSQKNNPTEAFRRVSRARSTSSIICLTSEIKARGLAARGDTSARSPG